MTASVPNLAVHTISGARIIEFSHVDMTDAALIKTVGDEIYHLVRGDVRPRLVIDFRKVQRLSSATLGMLIALDKVVGRQSGQLRIANLNDGVFDVFKITRLDTVFKICQSTEDAVASFT